MSWVETESLSFTARHDSNDAAFADRTLDRMETLRLRLKTAREGARPGDRRHPHQPGLADPWPTRSSPLPVGRRPRPGGAIWSAGRWRPSSTSSTTTTWNGAPPARTRSKRCAAPPSASTRSWSSPPTTPRRRPPGPRAASPATCAGPGWSKAAPSTSPARSASTVPPSSSACATRGRVSFPPSAPRCGDPRRHDLRPAGERARPRGVRAPRRRPPPRRPRDHAGRRLRRPLPRHRSGLARLPAGDGCAAPGERRLSAQRPRSRRRSR